MRRGQSIRASEVPDKVLASTPRVEGCTIWALKVVSKQASRLELGVDVD
jgi:hypothetical protein